MPVRWMRRWARCRRLDILVLLISLMFPGAIKAQTWTWTTEGVDIDGTDTSIIVDQEGNLHVSYSFSAGGELRYAFRPAGNPHWFKMTLDKGLGVFYSRITVDAQGNPHICYTPRIMKYAHFDGRHWSVQQVDPGGGLVAYTCSIRMGADGTPRLSWYVESGVFLRYAEFKDGVWMARTLDAEGLPGKWHSLVLDSNGLPRIAYIQFPWGRLKYTAFDGKQWNTVILDQPVTNPGDNLERGFGASLALDGKGNPLISYYDLQSLKMARLVDGKWEKGVIEQLPPFGQWAWKNFRSTLVLDSKGNPHVGFESLQGLEHAWWDGRQWRSQLIVAPVGATFFESAMTIDRNDNLYISFRDPGDGSLRVAIGHPGSSMQNARTETPKSAN